MFSYRHAFHAGNHADVLKHLTLIATLRHLMRKPAPLTLIDTHAGAGVYRLDDGAARLSGEAEHGVLRLARALEAPVSEQKSASAHAPSTFIATDSVAPALADYLALIAGFNGSAPVADWRIYPGSPFVMDALMSEPARAAVHDRLKLFEMHPTDAQALDAHVAQLPTRAHIAARRQDGFEGLRALLPPPAAADGKSRRALVLIDPSYEIKTDYAQVADAVEDALRRFATGVYLVWYPIIARAPAHALPRRLKTLARQAGRGWLHATLNVGRAEGQGGLSASGLLVINPPHSLHAALQAALPQVLQALAVGRGQGFALETDAG